MAIPPPHLRYWDWVLNWPCLQAHVNSKNWNGDTYWDTCICLHVHVYCNTVSKQSPNKVTDNVVYSYVSIIWLCTCTYVQNIYIRCSIILSPRFWQLFIWSQCHICPKGGNSVWLPTVKSGVFSLLFMIIYFN